MEQFGVDPFGQQRYEGVGAMYETQQLLASYGQVLVPRNEIESGFRVKQRESGCGDSTRNDNLHRMPAAINVRIESRSVWIRSSAFSVPTIDTLAANSICPFLRVSGGI